MKLIRSIILGSTAGTCVVAEVLAGDVPARVATPIEYVRGGKLKAMATLAADRIPLLTHVPTVRELGFANMELRGWNGFFAPSGTTAAALSILQDVIAKVAADSGIRVRFSSIGAEAAGADATALNEVLVEQVEKVRRLMRELKLPVG